MAEQIITRDSREFKDLRRNIIQAIRFVEILIDAHRPAIGNETYLTTEEICSIFNISKRSIQNYRDNRQIPYTMIGGKILYPHGYFGIIASSLCQGIEIIEEAEKIFRFFDTALMHIIPHEFPRTVNIAFDSQPERQPERFKLRQH